MSLEESALGASRLGDFGSDRLWQSTCSLMAHSRHYYRCVRLNTPQDEAPYLQGNFQMNPIVRKSKYLSLRSFYSFCSQGRGIVVACSPSIRIHACDGDAVKRGDDNDRCRYRTFPV